MIAKMGDVSRLPKWAQEYIYQLRRQVSTLEGTVRELQGAQEDSHIYYHAQSKDGFPDVRVNIPSSSIEVEAFGVELRVVVPYDGPEIRVSWGAARDFPNLMLPMLEPRSTNMVHVINPVWAAEKYPTVTRLICDRRKSID